MRHKLVVNEALSKQKKQEAKDLQWVQQNWDKINPGAEKRLEPTRGLHVWACALVNMYCQLCVCCMLCCLQQGGPASPSRGPLYHPQCVSAS
jgi:hypothetical protein